ncbi:PREDICTED: origin of replication complex subunit 4 isoform X3 [Tarenaya hassleriana]|uniref:origin of replication complex subunit 4 isoform X3 n=1 Tax=Tarenaya hassleriana TaxID=28532 RepID=UPI00053C9D52|nr:PREDICTED: origin of replication complex subunit 4 isoform X3 [Tarenaya hassleriana]
MEKEEPAVKSLNLIRGRLCNPSFVFRSLSGSPDGNYSKLKFIISSSVSEGCNNTILLLGPRGSGKAAVFDLVVGDLLQEFPDSVSVIRLNGLLHSDDNCAFKEIARQLCTEHHLLFSKMASFDENLQFMIAMLRECGLAHKTIIFVLDEFDMFAQGKQRLLYSLLDAMQSVTSQAVVVGISSRLDADQLLEKRVRSRFSNRKLLFLPPSKEELDSLLKITADARFKDILETFFNANSTVNSLLKLLFSAVSSMDLNSGLLSLENFKSALSIMQRQTKLEAVRDCSVLELYILVCMKRLEAKEQSSYNFNSVMKEYKAIHDSFQTSDYYARTVCLRAFEHLLQRELICYADNRGQAQTVEYRPANLLISAFELHHGMRSHKCCPAILLKLLDHL